MSRDDDPNNDLPQRGVPFGQRPPHDDEPEPDLEPMGWVRILVRVLVVGFMLYAMLSVFSLFARAQDRGYMPPAQYTRPEPRAESPSAADPLEYYAEDWIVKNQDDKVVCRDPYIMRDIKVVKCISRDPVR